jgi:hypothetical protein
MLLLLSLLLLEATAVLPPAPVAGQVAGGRGSEFKRM